jgi:ComF family protein
MLYDFFNLFFPDACISCETFLITGEQFICAKCSVSVVRSDSDPFHDEKVSRKFWGKVKINKCYSYFKYLKGGVAQKLIFAIKYDDKKELGFLLGLRFGIELKKKVKGEKIDLIVPVPLHKRKLRERGFNQSEWISKGIAQGIGAEMTADLVERTVYGLSLTRNTRFERWIKSSSIYRLKNGNQNLHGLHILLVDDVITTGSTLEAVADVLLKAGADKVSLAALASAV